MGKKSKKNAAGGAKAKGATSVVRSRDDAGATKNRDETGGGILTSTGGSSNKKQRCVLCCALLKDLAKARACPGCSLLFCWRCERKDFNKCFNGDNCVRPISKCTNCRAGVTMERELVAAGVLAPDEETSIADKHGIPRIRNAYEKIVLSQPDLTDDSWPIAVCGAPYCTSYGDEVEETLPFMECRHCALGPSRSKLLSCCRCKKIRCDPCSRPSETAFDAVCDQLNDLVGSGDDVLSTPSVTACWNAFINAGGSDIMTVPCNICHRIVCASCTDFTEQKNIIRTMWECNNDPDFHYPDGFKCSTCYWSAKPCTNPNCPNEVGIPTKRCGGCHIDRYCSVECQAAMHPKHVERCKTIQAKRASAGKGAHGEE